MFCLRDQFAVRKLQDEVPIFVFRTLGVSVVAVSLLHLLILNVSDFELGFGGLRHVGEERNEIAVFLFRLRQRGRPPFGIPGIAHRQLGTRDKLGIRIGVNQRLQRDTGHVEAVVLHGVHGLVEKDLIRLLGTDIR